MLSIWTNTGSWLHFLSKWPGRREYTSCTEERKSGTVPRIKISRFREWLREDIAQEAVDQWNVRLLKTPFASWAHPSAPDHPGWSLRVWQPCSLVWTVSRGFYFKEFQSNSANAGASPIYDQKAFEICSSEQLRASEKKNEKTGIDKS